MSTGEKFAGNLFLLPAALVLACHIPSPSSKVLLPLAVTVLVWAKFRRLPNSFIWLTAAVAYPGLITLTSPYSRPDVYTSLQEVALQLGALALVICALWRAPVGRAAFLPAMVLGLATLGLLGEAAGLPVQQWLPWHSNQADEFAALSFYIDGSRRLRGFSAEAGVLSLTIVTSALLFCAALEVCRFLFARTMVFRLLQLMTVIVTLIAFAFILTKSGIAVALGTFGAALAGMMLLGSWRQKMLIIGVSMGIGTASFLTVSYSNLRIAQYLRTEFQLVAEANTYETTRDNSALTRLICWRFAFATAMDNPMGVGRYGVAGTVARHSEIPLTPELQHFFKLGVYGLKSAGANILAQGGWVGVALWIMTGWSLFILPVWRMYRTIGLLQSEVVFAFALGGGLVAAILSAELFPYAGYWALGGLLVHHFTELQMEQAHARGEPTETHPDFVTASLAG